MTAKNPKEMFLNILAVLEPSKNKLVFKLEILLFFFPITTIIE